MISLDFFVAIALYLFLILLLVFGRWIFYNYNENQSAGFESKYLQQCPYCTYLFFDYEESKLKICPRCESYIATEKPIEE